jgi:chaperone required for assembly of F1-ATPase
MTEPNGQDGVPAGEGGYRDPIRLSQQAMRAPLPKRFYQQVTVAPATEGGHQVLLDGRPLRTPARRPLVLATAGAAEVVAEEWRAQVEVIDPARMPATRIANAALDSVAGEMAAVADEIVRYAGTDLVCYRAGEPAELVARQQRQWDPLLAFAHRELGARFMAAEGIVHVAQPDTALAAVSEAVRAITDPVALAALNVITTLTGSALVALAVAHGAVDPETAWAAAHVDEDWTNELWGEDAEAQARRAARFTEMRAACRLLLATRPPLTR